MPANRRQLLQATLAAPAALAAAPAPALPVHDIRAFGAVPDGATLNTRTIQQAIDQAARDGGGVVFVPPGNYLTGTLQIKDNVTLYLEAGATIQASKDRKDYQHACLLYAENAVNAAIRGRGSIDGNGPAFWKRDRGRWTIGGWRPGRLAQFVRCENLLLEDVTFRNSPAWTIHPVDCDRLAIRGISILNGLSDEDHGPNTDGIDPDGCTRVRISDCYIQSGDDSIVLKITNRPGGNRTCRDITVTNCVIITKETALKIGSETYGEFRNIAFSNCAIRDAGCGIGLWMRDGGVIDGWTLSNISMTLTGGGQPIYMTSYPRSRLSEAGAVPDQERPPGVVRNITISNVTAEADGAIFLSGMAEKPLEAITLDNIRITMRGGREKKLHADPPYPFPLWGHRQSPYDIFCRYVDDLKLRRIQLTWGAPEQAQWGSAIRCRHVTNLDIDGFTGRQSLPADTACIWLRDTTGARIHNCRAAQGAKVFLHLDQGAGNVSVTNNDLAAAAKAVTFGSGVDPKELYESGNRPPRT